MSKAHVAHLADRGVVRVTGADARDFLDNLITNDMGRLDAEPALHAALLTPQGKILFEFLVVPVPEGFLLDTAAAKSADLVRRLGLYKLRAKVVLDDLGASRAVVAAWGGPPPALPAAVAYPDPRHEALGSRLIVTPEVATGLAGEAAGADAYHAHRISLGVPEGGRDYPLGDAFPHEANLDRLDGVSFTKGCFVGQEVVARMQHKTVVRKRVVPIAGEAALTAGAEIRLGEAAIGTVGSVAGRAALALLRLDRAAEARAKGQPLLAGGIPVTVDLAALTAYEAAAAVRSGT